jgi:hypothetical protein
MATKPTYRVTDKSDLHYAGRVTGRGEIVSDLPGESIGWLVSDGYVTFDGPDPSGATISTPGAVTTASSDLSDQSGEGV